MRLAYCCNFINLQINELLRSWERAIVYHFVRNLALHYIIIVSNFKFQVSNRIAFRPNCVRIQNVQIKNNVDPHTPDDHKNRSSACEIPPTLTTKSTQFLIFNTFLKHANEYCTMKRFCSHISLVF
jgi:hypothetical protein